MNATGCPMLMHQFTSLHYPALLLASLSICLHKYLQSLSKVLGLYTRRISDCLSDL